MSNSESRNFRRKVSVGQTHAEFFMPIGGAVWDWIKQGGKPVRASMACRMMYRWQSYWFDRNASVHSEPTAMFAAKSDPVFILGLWRSGTTLMHELLATAPGTIYPTTWQCLNPSVFRLVPPPKNGPKVKRPMDDMVVGPSSPQEDEFALLALGVPSVYRGFFDPRRLPELSRWLDPEQWSAQTPGEWLLRWKKFLAGIVQGRDASLLLKSPNHSFRIRALIEAFPNARFLWLVRNPEDVFRSNRKMWLAMFERYALWDWDEDILDEFLTKAFLRGAECLALATNRLSRSQLSIVDFEALSTSTMTCLEGVCGQLNLFSWDEMKKTAADSVEARKGYRKATCVAGDLSSSALEAMKILHETQQSALRSHGL